MNDDIEEYVKIIVPLIRIFKQYDQNIRQCHIRYREADIFIINNKYYLCNVDYNKFLVIK